MGSQSLIILKLGGSVITAKKSGAPLLRTRHVARIARTLLRIWNAKHSNFILLHGAGSFGHPLVYRYGLQDAPITPSRLVGMGKTVNAVRTLTTHLAETFLTIGLPVIPLQTSAFVRYERKQLTFLHSSLIEVTLKHGGIPLFGGDVVFTDSHTTHIVSADDLVVALAKHYPRAKLFFATDVDGVYARFPPPPRSRPLPQITRRELLRLLSPRPLATPRDVTGGMMGKLEALLALQKRTVTIFNGTHHRLFSCMATTEQWGTTIRL
jgi:isopentenyl phosphate kinase